MTDTDPAPASPPARPALGCGGCLVLVALAVPALSLGGFALDLLAPQTRLACGPAGDYLSVFLWRAAFLGAVVGVVELGALRWRGWSVGGAAPIAAVAAVLVALVYLIVFMFSANLGACLD